MVGREREYEWGVRAAIAHLATDCTTPKGSPVPLCGQCRFIHELPYSNVDLHTSYHITLKSNIDLHTSYQVTLLRTTLANLYPDKAPRVDWVFKNSYRSVCWGLSPGSYKSMDQHSCWHPSLIILVIL